jgi:Dehydrogenases with different specificities (related to short-chain alcohol dehydrogenases)
MTATGNSQPAGSLEGLTAFVSGSSRGIGREVALALASGGASVAVHGRSADTAARWLLRWQSRSPCGHVSGRPRRAGRG